MGSRRDLARTLETVADFAEPRVDLEQYLTPPELAAHLLHLAGLQGDLDRPVVDLGTGTGMLAIAASLAGAEDVVGVDRDRQALARAVENATRLECPIEWIHADATRLPLAHETVTVVANPPFGAQRGNRHADRAFLETAASVAAVSYTIHNAGSQSFVESFVSDAGGRITHAFQAELPITHRFDFHDAERERLAAEVFRIEWTA